MITIINKSPFPCEYKTKASVGFDIYANTEVTLNPNEVAIIKTGLYLDHNEHHFTLPIFDNAGKQVLLRLRPVLDIRPRSSSAKTKLGIINSPGTVETDYPGEIGVAIINLGTDTTKINIGDRIAQGVVLLTLEAGNATRLTNTRTGGWGSTDQQGNK